MQKLTHTHTHATVYKHNTDRKRTDQETINEVKEVSANMQEYTKKKKKKKK